MKNGRVKRPDPQRQEHVADLAHGGIGQHPLDVGLGQGREGRQQQRQGSDDAHQPHHIRCQQEQPVQACNQINAGGHHGGRVDQGRHRSGACHGIRQPGVQRHLCRLAQGTAKDQQCRKIGSDTPLGPDPWCLLQHQSDIEGAEFHEDQEQPQGKEYVTCAGHDKRLERRPPISFVLIVVADKAVAAKANAFPTEKQQQQVIGQHQHQHAEHKQVHPGIEAGYTGLAHHVPDSEQVNQETHAGDDRHHDQRETINHHAHGRLELAHGNPGPEREPLAVAGEGQQGPGGGQRGQPHAAHANGRAGPRSQPPAGKAENNGTGQR